MNKIDVIEVTPDENGKIYIKMYGTRYEIRIKETKKEVQDHKVKKENI